MLACHLFQVVFGDTLLAFAPTLDVTQVVAQMKQLMVMIYQRLDLAQLHSYLLDCVFVKSYFYPKVGRGTV